MLFVALLLSFYSSYAFSQDTIFVRADRIKSSLEYSPSDISVFDSSQIQQNNTITELLSKDSDVILNQSGPTGGNTSIFLRGTDSSHTLVILDGIIMNDPANPNRQFDLGRLSLNNIERIEILKGSQGLLYGSNAIGGVILITSKKAKNKLSASTFLDYGSYSTITASADLQKRLNETGISFGIEHLSSEGFSAANDKTTSHSDADGVKRTTVSSGLNHSLSENLDLNIVYRYINDQVDLDKNGGNGGDDPNDTQWTEQQFLKLETSLINDKAESKIAYNKSIHQRTLNVKSDQLNPAESSVTTKGKIDAISINHSYFFNERLTLNANIDYQKEKDQLENSNENSSLYLYTRLESTHKQVLNIGGRIDYNKNFDEYITYKAAYLVPLEYFTIKTSYSTGFRAPSLNQLYDPTYGNKTLKPEKSQSLDLGISIPFNNNLIYEASLFRTDITDRLSYHPVTFLNTNSGKARITGIENSAKTRMSDWLSSALQITWLSAKDLSTHRRLARRPQLNSQLGIDIEKDKYRFSSEIIYVGNRADVDNAGNEVSMNSYSLINLGFHYKITSHASISFKLKNAFDKKYEEVFGYGTGGRLSTLGLKYIF